MAFHKQQDEQEQLLQGKGLGIACPNGKPSEKAVSSFSDFSKGCIFGCLMCGFIFVVFALVGN